MSFILRRSALHKPTAKWYSDYLLSPYWLNLKTLVLKVRGSLCERCSAPYHVLHHKTYARLFRESKKDVELLCEACHFKAHAEDDIPYLYLIYWESKDEVHKHIRTFALRSSEYITTPNKREKENTKQHGIQTHKDRT